MKDKIFEFFTLIGVRFRFSIFNFLELCKVIFRYYGNPSFRKWDLTLLSSYLFKSPYSISKRYLLDHGAEDPYLYGETPITSMDVIARRCNFSSSDLIYELGCGRGRCSFWLHAFMGCKVEGIEIIPEFVQIAQAVKSYYEISNVNFTCMNILDVDYSKATAIYLCGTCFEEVLIKKIVKKLRETKSGTKVVSVSYPLTDYTQKPLFTVVDRFSVPFGWGNMDVYLQVRNDS